MQPSHVSLALFFSLAACAPGPESPPPSPLVTELLALRPPPPPWKDHPAVRRWRRPPADSASVEFLIDYFRYCRSGMSPRAAERLRAAALADPSLRPLVDRVFRGIEREPEPDIPEEEIIEEEEFVDGEELLALDEVISRIEGRSGEFEGDDWIRDTLADLDWARAEPYAWRCAESEIAALRCLGLQLLYSRAPLAEAARLRPQLCAMVEDSSASRELRSKALSALLERPWPGFEEWYVALFADPTLVQWHGGFLALPIRKQPDRWIPIVSRLVGHSHRVVHNNAVGCLTQVAREVERLDAMLPLLPWVSDPRWASLPSRKDRHTPRAELIRAMGKARLPEALPRIIDAAQSDDGDGDMAIRALARFRDEDGRIAAALRDLRSRLGNTIKVAKTLTALDAITTAEQADAVEQGLRDGNVPDFVKPSNELAAELIARARSADPDLAQALFGHVIDWPCQAVHDEFIDRILDESATRTCLEAVLMHRDELSRYERVRRLAHEGLGAPRGIAAAIVGEPAAHLSDDREALRAFVACARWLRIRLDLGEVENLLDGDASQVAEAYLRSDLRPAARGLLQRRHAGEALVLGWHRNPIPPLEESLRKEVLGDGGPKEVYALIEGRLRYVVAVHEDRVELRVRDAKGSTRTRRLGREEWRTFKEFMLDNDIDGIPPPGHRCGCGKYYWYWHVTRDGGWRIDLDSLHDDWPNDAAYCMLVKRFWWLARR